MRERIGIWLLLTVWVLAVEAADPKSDAPFARVDRMNRELNGSCNYTILDKHKQNMELMCVLEALRSRCNRIDDCYVYCIGNDVGVDIGGGCAHLCNYGLRTKWEPPQGMDACKGKKIGILTAGS